MHPDFTMTDAENRLERAGDEVSDAAEAAQAAVLMKAAADVADKMGQMELRGHLLRESERLTKVAFDTILRANAILNDGAGVCHPSWRV